MPGPLAGMKVLDLSRLLPGPYCSMILGDLGAEVLKIEDPKRGDYMRSWGPRFGKESAVFVMLNRNKKSMTLNLKTEEGRAIFLTLVRQFDVVLEGFRPGVLERLGVGYEVLKKENPGLIYCAITGYGYTGPYRDRAGHDLNYLSLAGVLGMIGEKKGPPVIPGVQIADIGGGALLSALAILSACIARQRTGQGQFIDVSMLDGSFAWLPVSFGEFVASGEDPEQGCTVLTGAYACYRVYETKDGRHMGLGALEKQFWEAFCKAVDREDLVAYQFSEGEKQADLVAEVSRIFKERTRKEWIDFLKHADFCCEPVNSVSEAISDPQLIARDMIVTTDHPSEGKFKQIGIPVKFSDTPGSIRLHSPGHGEHTDEILLGLGYQENDLKELKEKGVID
jgi:crotonobetainyl-CoA:carnitine CoA-transferase CaiB-like acyl-CoA transferase